MPPESLWTSNAELAALCLLCIVLGQIAGRAVEGLIRKNQQRQDDPHDARLNHHSEEIGVLKSKQERTDRRLANLETETKEHRSWSENMTRSIAERLTRMETIGSVLSNGQDAITERLDAILERLAK